MSEKNNSSSFTSDLNLLFNTHIEKKNSVFHNLNKYVFLAFYHFPLSFTCPSFHHPDTMGNATLHFDLTSSSKKMSKVEDKIYINCTGPYILYMDVCYRSLNKKEITGILQLEVVERKTTVTSFNLTTSDEDCGVLHSIVYLRAKDQASLHIYAEVSFKIKNATLGLNYLLGTRCEYWSGPLNAWKAAQHLCSSAAVRTDTLSRAHTDGSTCV